jgi:GNAT superfamily N-acetyltransferase
MSGAVAVRALTRDDVPRVWELLRGLAEYERMTDILTGSEALLADTLFGAGPHAEGLVAEHGGRIVGYALFYPVLSSFRTRWRLWLEDLYVEPDARGTGAGRALMAALARIADARAWTSMDWEVLDWNAPALGFYERLGATRFATDWYRYRLGGDALAALARETDSDPSRGKA